MPSCSSCGEAGGWCRRRCGPDAASELTPEDVVADTGRAVLSSGVEAVAECRPRIRDPEDDVDPEACPRAQRAGRHRPTALPRRPRYRGRRERLGSGRRLVGRYAIGRCGIRIDGDPDGPRDTRRAVDADPRGGDHTDPRTHADPRTQPDPGGVHPRPAEGAAPGRPHHRAAGRGEPARLDGRRRLERRRHPPLHRVRGGVRHPAHLLPQRLLRGLGAARRPAAAARAVGPDPARQPHLRPRRPHQAQRRGRDRPAAAQPRLHP